MGKVMVLWSRLGDTLLLMGGRVSEIPCYLLVVASRRYAATYGVVASRRYAATYGAVASLRDYDESNKAVRATSVRLATPLCSTFDFLRSTLSLSRWDNRGRSGRILAPAEASLSHSTGRSDHRSRYIAQRLIGRPTAAGNDPKPESSPCCDRPSVRSRFCYSPCRS